MTERTDWWHWILALVIFLSWSFLTVFGLSWVDSDVRDNASQIQALQKVAGANQEKLKAARYDTVDGIAFAACLSTSLASNEQLLRDASDDIQRELPVILNDVIACKAAVAAQILDLQERTRRNDGRD